MEEVVGLMGVPAGERCFQTDEDRAAGLRIWTEVRRRAARLRRIADEMDEYADWADTMCQLDSLGNLATDAPTSE